MPFVRDRNFGSSHQLHVLFSVKWENLWSRIGRSTRLSLGLFMSGPLDNRCINWIRNSPQSLVGSLKVSFLLSPAIRFYENMAYEARNQGSFSYTKCGFYRMYSMEWWHEMHGFGSSQWHLFCRSLLTGIRESLWWASSRGQSLIKMLSRNCFSFASCYFMLFKLLFSLSRIFLISNTAVISEIRFFLITSFGIESILMIYLYLLGF